MHVVHFAFLYNYNRLVNRPNCNCSDGTFTKAIFRQIKISSFNYHALRLNNEMTVFIIIHSGQLDNLTIFLNQSHLHFDVLQWLTSVFRAASFALQRCSFAHIYQEINFIIIIIIISYKNVKP